MFVRLAAARNPAMGTLVLIPFVVAVSLLVTAGCATSTSDDAAKDGPETTVAQVSDIADGSSSETAASPDSVPSGDTTDGLASYTAILDLPEAPANYADPTIPNHLEVETLGFHGQVSAMSDDNTPSDNPTTDEGATLGRVLFYDAHLSRNGAVSCSSCHEAQFGFSDDRVLSEGFEGGETGRHSMSLTNARFYDKGRFFWDQRAATLEDQVLMPFQDPVEMGMTLESLVARVQAGDYYPALFDAAFGDDAITSDRISKALAQFVRSMVSTGSRYDIGRAQVSRRDAPFPNFTAQENLGKKLFVSPPPRGGLGCFVCHQGEAFIATDAASNGLDAGYADDLGYGEVTGSGQDAGTFKVPSLRNIALSPPYMHDGRFANLEAVMEHYSTGVQPSPNLGPPFFISNGAVSQLNLTSIEKAALIAFLNTLTDMDMVNDPKFSDPFAAD